MEKKKVLNGILGEYVIKKWKQSFAFPCEIYYCVNLWLKMTVEKKILNRMRIKKRLNWIG